MSNLLSGPAVFVGLPIVAIVVCVLLKTPPQLMVLLYSTVPLIASITLTIVEHYRSYPIISRDFVSAVAAKYILGLLLFGYSAPLFGGVARFIVLQSSKTIRANMGLLWVGGAVVGAAFGAALLVVLALAAKGDPNSSGDVYHALLDWCLTGAVSGAVSGLLIVTYLQPDHAPKEC